MLRGWAFALVAVLAFGCAPSSDARTPETARVESPTQVDGFVRELTKLDVVHPDGSRTRLETLITRPDRPGRLPLVVINHGTPREPADRARTSPTVFSAQSLAFARRGYAVAVVLRRGFGWSDGAYAESSGTSCKNRDYLASTRVSVEDVLGALHALQAESWVDPDRVLLVGQSTGGFAVLGTAATNPRGVVGAISFAGGRGSDVPDHICDPGSLVAAAGELGRTARVPTLWIYAENDHFFGPIVADQLHDEYTKAGGVAELVHMPAFGDDGHLLFSMGPTDLWWPRVEPFLAKLGLPIAIERPKVVPALDPPPSLGAAGREGFAQYLASDRYEKAFAVSGEHWGWAGRKRTRADAVEGALKTCAEHASGCTVYAVGDGYAR
jgi:dienelactone hydrolase